MDDTTSDVSQDRGMPPIANPAPAAPAAIAQPSAMQRPTAPAGQAPMQPRPPMQLREPNTILIGKKSVMAYVLAVVSQFNNGSTFVKLKARGKIISRAVDVAEIVKHRFIPTLHPQAINIGTEDLQSEDGTHSKVSSIEIIVVK